MSPEGDLKNSEGPRSESQPKAHETVEQPNSITSENLLGQVGLLKIIHAGDTYTLRITRNNRLILTK